VNTIVVQVMALLVAITFHELAHAWVSDRLGDPTPRMEGRVSVNPLAHIDPFGTVIFPLLLVLFRSPVLLGWAKPVPINPSYYRNPLKGRALVSLAGPGANLAVALVSAVVLKLVFAAGGGRGPVGEPLILFLLMSVVTNVSLMIFNLIPVPPLDGGHYLESVLPANGAALLKRLEPFGMLIIVGLMYTDILDAILGPLSSFLMRLLLR
jgi:Zn-dependent protease